MGINSKEFCITGLVTVEEGTVDNEIISLKSTSIGRMSGAKDPQVTQVKNVEVENVTFFTDFL